MCFLYALNFPLVLINPQIYIFLKYKFSATQNVSLIRIFNPQLMMYQTERLLADGFKSSISNT